MSEADWRQTKIAPEGTHHLLRGRPLYHRRFDEVLKYHSPGLAPVLDESGAYHIDVEGEPAYRQRYLRTFGFYDQRAAVKSADGWFHIRPDGTPLYDRMFRWVGNFQYGRCPVRLHSGLYGHVGPDGQPLYRETYRYAGDFRNGVAVVQNNEGMHTHIDEEGAPLHDRWFDDLDVFHKGFARARDRRGWHHVDRSGNAIYDRRFSEVEPFYNGQARAKRFDGGLEVIDESGRKVLELRPPTTTALQALSSDMVGFWKTQTIHAGVELGIFDLLPAGLDEVSHKVDIPRERARRVLRALWELELVEPTGEKRWELTKRGQLLASDSSSAMSAVATVWSRDHYMQWARLPELLRAPRRSDEESYFEALSDQELQNYQHAISGYARHDYTALPEAIDWSRHRCVIDAGGGRGILLSTLLESHDHLEGKLLDLPRVIEHCEVPRHLQGRIELLAADFFDEWSTKGDGVVLARVLHDWDDSRALRILRRARKALQPGGRLYVIEMVLDEKEPNGSLLDLNMLVMTGGRERSLDDWRRLLDGAGFQLLETRSLPAVSDILIGALK